LLLFNLSGIDATRTGLPVRDSTQLFANQIILNNRGSAYSAYWRRARIGPSQGMPTFADPVTFCWPTVQALLQLGFVLSALQLRLNALRRDLFVVTLIVCRRCKIITNEPPASRRVAPPVEILGYDIAEYFRMSPVARLYRPGIRLLNPTRALAPQY
jgi:hypothetical protein